VFSFRRNQSDSGHYNFLLKIHGKLIQLFLTELVAYLVEQQVKASRGPSPIAKTPSKKSAPIPQRDSSARLTARSSTPVKVAYSGEHKNRPSLPDEFYYACFLGTIVGVKSDHARRIRRKFSSGGRKRDFLTVELDGGNWMSGGGCKAGAKQGRPNQHPMIGFTG
jgi:hypothetical protein